MSVKTQKHFADSGQHPLCSGTIESVIPSVRLQAIIATSTISAIAIVIAGVLLFPVRTPTLADYLPADSVIAYAHGITAESHAALEAIYPELGSVMIGSVPTDAALVRRGDTPTWIIPSADQNGEMIQTFQSSTGTKLSQLATFQAFTNNTIAGDSWIFVQPQAEGAPATFAPFTAPTTPWLAETTSGGLLRLSFVEHEAFAELYHVDGLPTPIEGVTTLTTSNGKMLLEAMPHVLSPAISTGMAALLSATITDQLPSDISPMYDILPLLTEDTTIRIHASGGLLIRGTGNAQRVRTLTDRLHASFVQQSFSTVVHRESFDDGDFTIDFVDVVDADESSDEMQVLGWTVREATGPTGSLFTARQGGQFIIATDRSLFDAVLQQDTATIPVAMSLPLARLSLLDDSTPSLLNQLIPAFLLNMEDFTFKTVSLNRIGNMLSITFIP